MNRFLKWLGTKLFGEKATTAQSLRQTGARMSPAARATRPAAPPSKSKKRPSKSKKPLIPDFDATVSGSIDDAGPGKNVLIRNRFVREDTGTHDTLKILDDSVLESDDEIGIDPYNTGRFDRSKSWNSRIRK
jgi:hypothetical protein